MVPKRALLSPVTTPPVGFQTRPPVLLQVFLHSGNLFSIPVCTEVVCLYFTLTPLCYKLTFLMWTFLMYDSWDPVPLRFVSALPESLAVFLCFYQVPILCSGDSYQCVQENPLSPFSLFLTSANLEAFNAAVQPNTWWGGAGIKAAAHWGAFRDTFLMWKSSLKNLTDTKLKSTQLWCCPRPL